MEMKKSIIMALMTMAVTTAGAQEKKTIELPAWLNNVKLSGYGMTQYQYSGQKGKESNFFNIRMGRIALEGRIANDFYWKAQIQFNGNTSDLGSSPRMVDLFAEWQKYSYFRDEADVDQEADESVFEDEDIVTDTSADGKSASGGESQTVDIKIEAEDDKEESVN